MAEPYGNWQVAAGLIVSWLFAELPQTWYWLVTDILSSQRGLSHMPPCVAQATTNPVSLCSSYQVLPGWSQVDDLGLQWSPSQEAPEPTYLEVNFRPQQSTIQLAPQVVHTKGSLNRHQTSWGQIPFCGGYASHKATHKL